MKQMILFLLVVLMMICPSASEPIYINNASTMPELLVAVNNSSILDFSDGYYTIYEQINVTTDVFTITDNTRIDTYAFLDFNSTLHASDCTIRGFVSGRKSRTDSRYITSGYVIVRDDLTMYNMYLRGLGSEYKSARYNDGITVYGNSDIADSIFEYVTYITVKSNKIIIEHTMQDGVYYTTVYQKTINLFTDNEFKHSDVIIYNSADVSFNNCRFERSKLRTHHYDNLVDEGIHVDACTFTDTNDRPAGDGHYSGIYGYWTNLIVNNSIFNNCDLVSSDRSAHVTNCTVVLGDIVLDAACKSSVENSTLSDGAIHITRSGNEIVLDGNNIHGGEYGIKVGTLAKYGHTAISEIVVSNNEIYNTTTGISIIGAHGNGYPAYFHDNHVYNSTTALHTHSHAFYGRVNKIYNNQFDGDVRIANAQQSLYDNQITGTLYIDDSIGNVRIKNNTALRMNLTNSIDVLIESCQIPTYNLFDNSSSNHILSDDIINVTVDSTVTNLSLSNASYVFNGSTHLSHDNMSFTVHIGNLSEVNTTHLNGTFDLMKDSVLFMGNVSTINDCLLFATTMGIGNYSMVTHAAVIEETKQAKTKKTSHRHGWKAHVIVPPRNNTTINITVPTNTTIKVNNDSAPIEVIKNAIERESRFKRFINIMLKWFR